ncbi:MAG: dephospho-CoA kinase [Chloroflexota bacterium]
MRIVGLTGRIGTGKSTVAAWLAEYGARVVDSDALVAELYETDATLQGRLRTQFGQHVVREARVDRAVLRRALVEPAAVAALEEIVHPAVQALRDKKLAAARADGTSACVVEAIKLVESGGSAICDELWIVVAGERVQFDRLARRGMEEAEARRRMEWQGTPASWTEGFLAESTRLGEPRPVMIFDNSGSEDQGRAQVSRLWRGVSL